MGRRNQSKHDQDKLADPLEYVHIVETYHKDGRYDLKATMRWREAYRRKKKL